MRHMIHIGRLYISWGWLDTHHHFAKAGEPWTAKYAPSQPRPVWWQLVRGDGWKKPKPPIWILWIYPKDGSAIHIEFGRASKPFVPSTTI